MFRQTFYGLRTFRGSLALVVLLLSMVPIANAGEEAGSGPIIAVIIDDMGNESLTGEEALELPGPVTLSFLPHTPHAKRLAERAYRRNKEIMLHLPMESHAGNNLGPGALTLHMTEENFRYSLKEDLDAIPHVAGLNNHMGSLLTRHPGAMEWLMTGVREYGDLYFVDSRTTLQTVAEQVAQEEQVPVARRDVFLDNNRDPEAIGSQFRQLIRLARKRGYAIGIGHPYPETIAVLKQELPQLDSEGIRLVRTSELIQLHGGNDKWPGSSSLSPKVVKNLKQ